MIEGNVDPSDAHAMEEECFFSRCRAHASSLVSLPHAAKWQKPDAIALSRLASSKPASRNPATRNLTLAGAVQPVSLSKAPSPTAGVVVLTYSLILYDHDASICLRAFVLNGFCSCAARSISAPKALKRFLCFPIQGEL